MGETRALFHRCVVWFWVFWTGQEFEMNLCVCVTIVMIFFETTV